MFYVPQWEFNVFNDVMLLLIKCFIKESTIHQFLSITVIIPHQ